MTVPYLQVSPIALRQRPLGCVAGHVEALLSGRVAGPGAQSELAKLGYCPVKDFRKNDLVLGLALMPEIGVNVTGLGRAGGVAAFSL